MKGRVSAFVAVLASTSMAAVGRRDLNSRLIRDYSRTTLERAMTACAPAEGCFSP